MNSRRILRQFVWAVGCITVLLMASPASAQRGGFGFSIGGGGGGWGGGYGGGYGGRGYHSSSTHWGVGASPYGVGWGVNVPLGNSGVRIGVGNYGYSPYYRHYYWNDRGYGRGYGYDDYSPSYSAPSADYYSEYAPANPPKPPPLPTAAQLARLSDVQLRQILADAAEGYSRELDGFNTGDSWKKHFRLTEVQEFAKKGTVPFSLHENRDSPPSSNPPDAAQKEMLADVLAKMDAASQKPAFEVITEPYGFRLMHLVLREYTLPVAVRQGHLLAAQVPILKLSLDGLNTGENWKKHLELDALENVAENLPISDPATGQHLEKILAKFDAAAEKPQYQIIARQDGFQAVRTSLQNLIQALGQETPKQEAPPPPAGVSL
ncbi:MAG: hypothetical protein JXB10_19800 [Pirellulales bacterium]|nr:hypothetical protein [Pirellulales bacterium]